MSTARRGVAAGALAVGAALLLGPAPPDLGSASAGDPGLAARTRDAAGDGRGFRTLAVADGQQLAAGLGGATADTAFELGSVAKPLTGMLLADLVDTGAVRLDDTLGELLPDVRFADADVAGTTVEQLATHRSGLPRDVPGGLLRRLTQGLGNDPFGELSPGDVLAAAAAADAGPREPSYSNFGFAVLGQALARHAGMPYEELLRERVLAPLGMTATVVVRPGEALPGEPGELRGGTPAAPWRGWGYAPAGGAIWSTAADLGRLVGGVATGTAPGAWAALPRAQDPDGDRVGLGWVTSEYPTAAGLRAVTWHNGGTTGYRTWVGFDRGSGTGVAVLSATARSADPVGLRLLGIDRPDPPTRWGAVAVTLFLLVYPVVLVVAALVGRRRDRIGVPATVASAAVVLWLAHLAGAWDTVPPAAWGVALVVVAVGVAVLVGRWPQLPVVSGPARRRWWAVGADLAFTATVAALLLWATT